MRRVLLAFLLMMLPAAAWAQSPQSWDKATASTAAATPPTPVPASIAGSGTYSTGCVPAPYSRAFDVFAAVAGAATLQVQRYADVGTCADPVGVAVPSSPQALTQSGGCPGSTYCGDVGINDGMPYLAFVATLTDTSGSTNAVTKVVVMQGAE